MSKLRQGRKNRNTNVETPVSPGGRGQQSSNPLPPLPLGGERLGVWGPGVIGLSTGKRDGSLRTLRQTLQLDTFQRLVLEDKDHSFAKADFPADFIQMIA